MRPASPILNFAAGLRPSSPPQTPTAPHAPFFLPEISMKAGPGSGPGGLAPPDAAASLSQPSNVLFSGNGQSAHTNYLRPEELLPCSPETSVPEVSEPEEHGSSDDESGPASPVPPTAHYTDQDGQHVSQRRVATESSFVIEEISDFDEDDMQDTDSAIQPHMIEYADSERSRSQTRLAPDDPRMINGIRNLKCRTPDPHASSSSDDSDLDDDAHQAILEGIRAAERRKRMSHSSIGTKRTMSDRGSDSDHEDVPYQLSFDDAGSSARRLKRRMAGDRRSLNFSDPPPRIDEVVEPAELEEALARELPFYEYASMEIDSPRSP